jgi:hypothetical protein
MLGRAAAGGFSGEDGGGGGPGAGSMSADPFSSEPSFDPGHITASAFVVHPTERSVALVLHSKIGRGGCSRVVTSRRRDTSIVAAAIREVPRRSGWDLPTTRGCVMSTSTCSPSVTTCPRHLHHDVRVAFTADSIRLVDRATVPTTCAGGPWRRRDRAGGFGGATRAQAPVDAPSLACRLHEEDLLPRRARRHARPQGVRRGVLGRRRGRRRCDRRRRVGGGLVPDRCVDRASVAISSIPALLQTTISAVASWLILAAATWFAATRLFKTGGGIQTTMATHGLAYLPTLTFVIPIAIVPVIGLIWYVAVLTRATQEAVSTRHEDGVPVGAGRVRLHAHDPGDLPTAVHCRVGPLRPVLSCRAIGSTWRTTARASTGSPARQGFVRTVAGLLEEALGRVFRQDVSGGGRRADGHRRACQAPGRQLHAEREIDRLQVRSGLLDARSGGGGAAVRGRGPTAFSARFDATCRDVPVSPVGCRECRPAAASHGVARRSSTRCGGDGRGSAGFRRRARLRHVLPPPEGRLARSDRVASAGFGGTRWIVVVFEIRAKAFCHQMVRSLTGFLVEVGRGRRAPTRWRRCSRP